MHDYLKSDRLYTRLRAFGASVDDAYDLCERAAFLEYDAGLDRKAIEQQIRQEYLERTNAIN